MDGSQEKGNLIGFVSKLLNLIRAPPAYIIDQRNQLRYQFILGFSLVTCPILVFAQIVSDTDISGIPIFLLLAVFILTSLILSRYGHLDLAIVIDLLFFSFYPYISLIFKEAWSLEYSLLVLIWIPITMLIGGYLLNQREAALFIASHDIVFLIVILSHPGASIFMSAFLETTIPLFGISLLIFIGSWARQRHIRQLAELNQELNAKNKELNVYASLLIHDIGNDLQVTLFNTELASLTLELDSARARGHTLSALAAGRRMGALLKAFSESRTIFHFDIVTLIERIAEEAMTTHGNIEILVTTDEQCRRYGSRSRLFSMIFVNLFRNSATYAGTTPIVEVSFSMNSDEVVIVVSDNGPGIDPSIRDNLFERGVTGTNGGGTGMGLYLIKQIIEIHDGTISLLDDDEYTGCGFRITLPCASLTQLT